MMSETQSPLTAKKKSTMQSPGMRGLGMKKKATLMQQREEAAKQKKASKFGVAGTVSI